MIDPLSRPVSCIFSALLTTALASAQMSGLYTVDPNGTGARNFKDARLATLELTRQGVTGPVVIEFATATYSYPCYVVPIPGASATNTVTLKSKVKHGATFLHTSNSANVLPNGFLISGFTPSIVVKHLIIDGFLFTDVSGGAHQCIRSLNFTDEIEVKNCKFQEAVIWVASDRYFPSRRWNIHHNEVISYIAIEVHAEGFAIHHNLLNMWLSGSIKLEGGSNPKLRGRFYNNVVLSNSGSPAIDLKYKSNIDIEHNTIVTTRAPCIHVDGKFGLPNEINNNILVSRSTVPPLRLDKVIPYNFFLDGNLYWSSMTNLIAKSGGTTYTLALWRSKTGNDAHGMFVSPKFDPGQQSLQVGSPAAQKAWMTRTYVTDDFVGKTRHAKPTIGAYEGDPGPPPTSFTVFGSGCAGAGGRVPEMGYTGELKLGSSNFTVTLRNARGGIVVPGFLSMGASNTSWNGINLPLALGGGCSVLVSLDILLRQTVSGSSGPGNGAANVRIPIPNDPRLKGVEVYFQWGIVDPAAKAIGIAFSNGGVLRI